MRVKAVTLGGRTAVAPACAALLVLAAGACQRSDVIVDHLNHRIEQARRQPSAATFALGASSADGGTETIWADVPSRLTFHVKVPPRAWMRASVGVRQSAAAPVVFFAGVSDGRVFRQVWMSSVTAPGQPHAMRLDLRQYEGLTVDVILNARSEQPVEPKSAFWSDPMILRR